MLLQDDAVPPHDLSASSLAKETGRVVGLVPAAVGATCLEEWEPSFCSRDSSGIPKCTVESTADVKEAIFISTPDNANYQPHANRGCHNLLSCALRSFYSALLLSAKNIELGDLAQDKVAKIRSLVGGLIWSQGENDTVNVPETSKGVLSHLGPSAADSYADRQAAFLQDFRWAFEGIVWLVYEQSKSQSWDTIPPPPNVTSTLAGEHVSDNFPKTSSRDWPSSWPAIVTVAITGTRPWMVHLRDVRHHQLAVASQLPNLITVDSLGGFLKTDCVHLTTAAALILGHLLASAMAHLLSINHAEQSYPFPLSIADVATRGDVQHYSLFCKARSRCEDILNDYYNSLTRDERQKNKKKYPIFGTGLKPVNFVS